MTIKYNGKILGSKITGVQRYVLEIASRLKGDVLCVSPGEALDGLTGHFWEQFLLPLKLRGALLWSPSNTGPLLVGRQVVTIHDVAALDHPEWMSRKFAKFYQFLTPRLVRRVRKVIVVSAFTKQRLVALTGVAAEKVVVVHNGVDERFRPCGEAEIVAAGGALGLPGRRYVLTVGSLEPRKNLGRLLSAWGRVYSQLPEDMWLVIAGGKGKAMVFGGDTGVEALPPRVYLTGHVADELLPALYAGAAGFAYMSLYEGFGLPPLEAMASGVPVLVSGSTVFPEVVGDAAIYADPLDVDDIAAGLVRLLTDAGLAAALAAKGLERAKYFTWERSARETLAVLAAAAGRV